MNIKKIVREAAKDCALELAMALEKNIKESFTGIDLDPDGRSTVYINGTNKAIYITEAHWLKVALDGLTDSEKDYLQHVIPDMKKTLLLAKRYVAELEKTLKSLEE